MASEHYDLRQLAEFTSNTGLLLQTHSADSKLTPQRASGVTNCKSATFTEAGDTTYTATLAVPAGSLVLEIWFESTVLWDDGTSALLDLGDDDDPNGYFAAIDLKATDLLVGEVLKMSNSENWGGKQGVYLVAATGLNSAANYATDNNIIGIITTGGQDGTAGRSQMWVFYTTPTVTASTAVA